MKISMYPHPEIKRLVLGGLEGPTGQPLYAYRVHSEAIDELEHRVDRSIGSDDRVENTNALAIQALAIVASYRFLQFWERGPATWLQCGRVVGRLRRNVVAFDDVMAASLRFWRVDPLRKGNRNYRLSTIVANSGIPAWMLEEPTGVRELINELIKSRIAHGTFEQLLGDAQQLASELSARSRERSFLYLCCGVADVAAEYVARIARGEDFERIWHADDWAAKLPFQADPAEARRIFESFVESGRVDSDVSTTTEIQRYLVQTADEEWEFRARAVFRPGRGETHPVFGFPGNWDVDVVTVALEFDGAPVEEVLRVTRRVQDSGKTRYEARMVDLPENGFGRAFPQNGNLADLALSVTAYHGRSVLEPESGGGLGELKIRQLAVAPALPTDQPWVFVNRPKDAVDTPRWILVAVGHAQVPEATAIVAYGPEMSLVAEPHVLIQPKGSILVVHGGAEERWNLVQTNGPLIVRGIDGEYTIQPGSVTEFVGFELYGPIAPYVRVVGVPTVYSGRLNGRVLGTGAYLVWRFEDEPTDAFRRAPLHEAEGLVRIRLVDSKGVAVGERRVLIIPELRVRQRSQWVELEVVGDDDSGDDVIYQFDAESAAGEESRPSSNLRIVRHSRAWLSAAPGLRRGVRLEVRPEHAPPSAAFVDAATRSVVSVRAPGQLGTVSAQTFGEHHKVVRFEHAGERRTWPFPLREPAALGGLRTLPLCAVPELIRELSYQEKDYDDSVTIRLAGDVTMDVCRYDLELSGDRRSVRLEPIEGMPHEALALMPMASKLWGLPWAGGTLERVSASEWTLPSDLPPGPYLIVSKDNPNSLRPKLLDVGPVAEPSGSDLLSLVLLADRGERVRAIKKRLRELMDELPSEASRQELEAFGEWLYHFRHVPVDYLDAKRAITLVPDVALKLLGYYSGRRGADALRWTFQRVPLFWHCLNLADWNSFHEWSDRCGMDRRTVLRCYCEGVSLIASSNALQQLLQHQETLVAFGRPLPLDPAFATALFSAWREASIRLTTKLDRECIGLPEIEEALPLMQSKLPSDLIGRLEINGRARPYQLAPLALAASVVTGNRIPLNFRREAAYVRRLGGPESFDGAYYSAFCLFGQEASL